MWVEITHKKVSLSEWLRSETWNLMGFPRAGSNPAADVFFNLSHRVQLIINENLYFDEMLRQRCKVTEYKANWDHSSIWGARGCLGISICIGGFPINTVLAGLNDSSRSRSRKSWEKCWRERGLDQTLILKFWWCHEHQRVLLKAHVLFVWDILL